ncbi:2-polyprenyl-6-methoxyphenol hydroxylase-like FAD-dependent oxidoreductase [Allocatelliglobosispora scoriae]|uniref:2-polyprenyl-6-methoxyphenol hydroxylase-like FAD-dependent oxidoreductase n=1 Tax=Allocatelliglobosispora scoriae TaxID=643052 RepID=A0A841BNF6_9ACTN|nr:FAD-dependent monooxygenase [Allocatelliglobosispora scoriae]MBB5868918.1 2-polyprenyl-6-methoxyphenol hydroxylase-like FAD-dependent oxidoreductase [Allocatelliglobosispora scoriae]
MTAARTALIIGGGIAGPVTALALRRAGIEATVYEAYGSSSEGIGGILMIAPNGLDALRLLGLAEAVAEIGQPMAGMAIVDATNGKTIMSFDGLPGQPPSRTVWRSDLFRVLHDRAAAEGIPIEYGKRLVGIDESPTGVTARFADGTTASADILIGADGIRSTVRSVIDPAAPSPRYVGLQSFAGHGPAGGEPGPMHFAQGKRAFLGYWTFPDGRIGWFSNVPYAEPLTMAQARQIPAAEWLKLLREMHADDIPARDLIAPTTAEELYVFGPTEIMPSVPRWYRDRLVLVGDSAHAPSSSSGQGASLAVESAVQLARCLRDLPDLPSAFAAYERLRRPRVQKVAAFAARQNDRKASGPVARAVMGVVMPLMMKTIFTPERMFGWMHGYRIDWDETVTA